MNLIKQYLKNKFANQPSIYAPRAPHNLPSNYWEPTPDEEDYKRIEREVENGEREGLVYDEPLPFD